MACRGIELGIRGNKRVINRKNQGMAKKYIRVHEIPSTERTYSEPHHFSYNIASPYLYDPFNKVEVLTAQSKDSGLTGCHTVSLGSFWHFEGAKSVPRILDA
jgi:hypothetical protein